MAHRRSLKIPAPIIRNKHAPEHQPAYSADTDKRPALPRSIPRATRTGRTPSASNEPELWTFHAGIGSPKAWNLIGITREYITGGLGTALFGAGVAYYGNREGNGVVASSAIGVVDLQATLAYQLKVGKQDFFAVGGSYGMLFMQCWCWLPVLSYEHRY